MRTIVSTIFLIISFLLQSTLLSQFTIGGIIPNLVLIVIASVGFLNGRKSGLVMGFIIGLVFDVFYGSIIGLYALLYMCIGFANGTFKKILFPGDIKLPLLLILTSDIAYGNVCYILTFLLNGKFNYLFYVKSVILPEVVYTTICAFAIYPIINAIFKRIEAHEKLLEGEDEIE